jgi:hypothetical protein
MDWVTLQPGATNAAVDKDTGRNHLMSFKWPAKRRVLWLLGALALMFVSAYSILKFYSIGSNVSGWIGLPQYAAQIPQLEAEARWWGRVGVVLPFLAALLLGFGRDEAQEAPSPDELRGRTLVTCSAEPREWAAPILQYLVRFGISLLGTFGFMVLLLLILFVFYKLGKMGTA